MYTKILLRRWGAYCVLCWVAELYVPLFCSAALVSIPPGMVQDQFGMMGLLTFIRGAETDPNLVALALGRYFSARIWAISVCDLYTVCNYCSHNLFVQWPHYSWTESEFSRVSIIICSNLVFVKCVWRYLCRVTNYTGHISITYVAIPDRNCVFCMFNVLYPLIVRFIHTS